MESCLLTWENRDQWIKYLNLLPPNRRDIYFSPGYCHADAGSGDGKICAWFFSDGTNCAIYPFRRRALKTLELLPSENSEYYDIEGFYGYGGVAASTDDPAFAALFYREFENFCREQHIAVEMTRLHPLLQNENFSAGNLEICYIQDTVVIDLTNGYDQVWQKGYDAKNRNMIRKSAKSGVTCRQGTDWTNFQRLYWRTMDNCGAAAAYYFKEPYFEELKNLLSGEGRCLLLEAVWENQVVAALLLMLNGDYAHYHLSARDPDQPQLAATNLLLDYAVQTAIAEGAKQMHLGGGKMVNDSLMRFKAGFSPLRGRYCLGFKAHNQEIYQQLCSAWENKHPELAEKYRKYYLKYRYQ